MAFRACLFEGSQPLQALALRRFPGSTVSMFAADSGCTGTLLGSFRRLVESIKLVLGSSMSCPFATFPGFPP